MTGIAQNPGHHFAGDLCIGEIFLTFAAYEFQLCLFGGGVGPLSC